MTGVILAAGYATRLYPLTKNFPKPLLPVRGKCILDWIVDDISDVIKDYIVISNHRFASFFEEWAGTKEGLSIRVIDDGTINNESRLGAVKDLQLAIEKTGIRDDLLVMAGDNLLDFSLKEFLKFYHEKNTTSIMYYYEPSLERVRKCAEVVCRDDGVLLEMNEKPENPKSHFCSPAFYILKRENISMVSRAILYGVKTDAPGSLMAWLSNHIPMHAFHMPGARYDIGTLDGYRQLCDEYEGYKKFQ